MVVCVLVPGEQRVGARECGKGTIGMDGAIEAHKARREIGLGRGGGKGKFFAFRVYLFSRGP